MLVAGSGHVEADGVGLDVDQAEGPLHRSRLQPADSVAVRMVEEHQQLQEERDDDRDAAHQHALGRRPFGRVGEEQQVGEDDGGDGEQGEPQRKGDDALRPVDPGDPRLLPVGGLVHPPVVGGLLGGRARVDRRDGQEHLGSPRVDPVAERSCGERVPLGPRHVARVADQLARELAGHVGQELGRLDLLGHDRRLCLGAGTRLVVRRERQEDDEAEQDREAGGEHAEDARGSVTVGEVAALGRPSAHHQHRRHRDRGDDER